MGGLTYRPRLFHSPFDRLRANGKILNIMAVTLCVGTPEYRSSVSVFVPTLERGNDRGV